GCGQCWVYRWFDRAGFGSPATAGLCQRERDCADGHKQQQVECDSNEMRFDGGINLLFHGVLSLFELWFLISREKCIPGAGHSFYPTAPENVNTFFLTVSSLTAFANQPLSHSCGPTPEVLTHSLPLISASRLKPSMSLAPLRLHSRAGGGTSYADGADFSGECATDH